MVMSKNKFFTLSFLFFILFNLFTVKSVSAFTGIGSGTTESPYQITSCAQFLEINNSLTSNYILENDINCNGVTWTPIGTDPGIPFAGVLNGNNKKISNVNYNPETDPSFSGLFGAVNDAQIKDLTLENITINTPASGNCTGGLIGGMDFTSSIGSSIVNVSIGGSISGGSNTGMLVGFISGGNNFTITNSSATGSISGGSNTGMLVGFISISGSGNITNSSATGSVSGSTNVGGLVGHFYGTLNFLNSFTNVTLTGISNLGGFIGRSESPLNINLSYSKGTINVQGETSDYIGGFVGTVASTSTIENSYSKNIINGGRNYLGGLVGYSSGNVEISNSFSTGGNQSITGNSYIGGLIGNFSRGTIHNSYSTVNVSGSGQYIGGLVGYVSIGSNINNSYSIGSVDGTATAVGGLIGYSDNGTISSCYSTGTVTGDGIVGGLIGRIYGGSIVSNSYSFSDVYSNDVSNEGETGGLVGSGETGCTIENSYSAGAVDSLNYSAGGLLGVAYGTTVTNSLYDDYLSGQSDTGKGTPSSYMTSPDTFSSWNFTDIWSMDSEEVLNDGYPFLKPFLPNFILTSNKTAATSININSSNQPSGNIWIAPAWTTTFTEGSTMTRVSGDSSSINVPQTVGEYRLYFIDSLGNISSPSLSTINVTSFSGSGNGTSQSPYKITTCSQLQSISSIDLNAVYSIENNIDCSGVNWTPIGLNPDEAFTGTLIGNNKTVSNINIENDFQFNGFFGDIDNGYVKDLKISNINVGVTSYNVGGLTGTVDNAQIGTTISNVHVTGSLYGKYAGGIIGQGFQSSTTVSNSSFEGNIYANDFAGGILGLGTCSISNSYSTGTITEVNSGSGGGNMGGIIGGVVASNGFISNSYSTININTPNSNGMVGGLVGQATSPFSILNSYATGDISGKVNVGGLIGLSVGTSITNTYSKGEISGTSNVGGLLGFSGGSTVINSYYDSETSGQSDTGKGTPKTTEEMKTQSTFIDWDFNNIWKIDSSQIVNSGYPILRSFIQYNLSPIETAPVSGTITISPIDEPNYTIWIAPVGTTNFTEGSTMTKSNGDSSTLIAPSTPGTYQIYILDGEGNILPNVDTSTITVIEEQSTPTPTPNNGSSSNSSGFSIPDTSCHDSKPIGISDLFQINVKGNTAKLFFTPMSTTNNYFVSFSEKPNAEEHGEQVYLLREGVQSHTIYQLKPNTTYYFKVRGQNGCMPGEWSNIMKIKTGANKSTKTTIFYKSLLTKVTNLIKTTKSNITKTKDSNVSQEVVLPNNSKITPSPQITNVPTKTENIETKEKKCFLWWCW